MSNKSEQYVSSLLGAIDAVLSERLKHIAYDQTIICTIVDDSKSKNGEYQVTDGSVKFWAQCENTNYRNNEQVRVQIPNGDMTQEKFIIGKYTKNTDMLPITYLSPVDSVLKISGNLITATKSTYTLVANGDIQQSQIWDSHNLATANNILAYSQVYNTIYLEAEFKSLLSNYNIKTGNYGLILEIYPELPNGSAGAPVRCILDCSDMLGNPYAFSLYTKQAATFNISNIAHIHSMKLLFVQDGQFKTINDVPIEPSTADGKQIANLFVKNIQVGFGSHLSDVEDNTVQIFTPDATFYGGDTNVATSNNEKTLNLLWYNKDSKGTYVGWTDGEFADEDQYQSIATKDTKLKAILNYDIPIDEAGLQAAVNLTEWMQINKELSRFLSVDVNNILFASSNNLQNRLPNDPKITSFLNSLSNQISLQKVTAEKSLVTIAEEFETWGINALNKAAVHYNQKYIPQTLLNDWKFKWDGSQTSSTIEQGNYLYGTLRPYYTSINTTWFYSNGVFLKPILNIIEDSYPQYRGVYDEFERRFAPYMDKIHNFIQKLNDLFTIADNGNTIQLLPLIQQYITKTRVDFTPWIETPVGTFDNKYCIYWYRQDSTAAGDAFMSPGWQRITFNPGDARNYSSQSISVTLDAKNKATEQFQAVVIFNHVCYRSNILTFTNESDITPEGVKDLSAAIHIQHGTNSRDSYQSYSIANVLINSADQYVNRELSVYYTHANGTADNSQFSDTQLYWYIPEASTMLDYNLDALQGLNPANQFIVEYAINEPHSEHYKPGYICFYKSIKSNEYNEAINDLKFTYRIKNYYSSTASNNSIICKLVKNGISYETEILFTFSSYGTSGTEYTLHVAPMTSQAALSTINSYTTPWYIKIALYDHDNNPIDLSSLSQGTVNGIPTCPFTITKLITKSRVIVGEPEYIDGQPYWRCPLWYDEDTEDRSDWTHCGILKIKLSQIKHSSNEKLVDLTTFFPVPFSTDPNFYIEGPSTIVYNPQGTTPIYHKVPYKLYKQFVGEQPQYQWTLKYSPNTPSDEKIRNYLPVLDPSTKILTPSHFWIENGDVEYDALGSIRATYRPYVKAYYAGSTDFWEQPLVILQNRYASPMLNAWDGSLQIDEENGTILSTMVGAGYKGTDNSFYGVLMGDIAKGANSSAMGGVGLYGYHAGAQSFGFNIDGTAFIGKSGHGRLIFDGNNATIADPAKRLLIDFNDGRIEGKNFTLKGEGQDKDVKTSFILSNLSPYFQVIRGDATLMEASNNQVLLESPDQNISLKLGSDSTFKLEAKNGKQTVIKLSNSSPYITVNTTTGANLFQASDSGVFLQDPSGEKVKISLTATDSSIVATNFTLSATSTSGSVTISSVNTSPINVNNKFIVNWDGSFSVNRNAFSVTASGTLSANNGTVKIDANGLTVTQGSFNLGNGNFQVDYNGNTIIQNGTITINAGAINLGSLGNNKYAFTVDNDGKMTLLNRDSSIEIGISEIDENNPKIKINPDNGLYMEEGEIRLGRIPNTSSDSEFTHYVTINESGFTLLHPNTVIKLGQSSVTAGDFAIYIDSKEGLKMHQGVIQLGKVANKDGIYNVEISSAAINLGYDTNATGDDPSYFFSVTDKGAMTLYHKDSVIELGQSEDTEAGDPAIKISGEGLELYKGKLNLLFDTNTKQFNFIVNEDGVTIRQGNINLADNFIVTDKGKVTIKSGSIQLGAIYNNSTLTGYNFSVTDTGVVNMNEGSINLGKQSDGTYNFSVTDTGVVTIKKGSISLGECSEDKTLPNLRISDDGTIEAGIYSNASDDVDLGAFTVTPDGQVIIQNSLKIQHKNTDVMTLDDEGVLQLTSCSIQLAGSVDSEEVSFEVTPEGKLTARSVNIENFLEIEGSLWVHNTEGSYVDIYAEEIWMGLDEGSSELWIEAFSTIGSISPYGAKENLKKYNNLEADLYIASDVFTAGSFIFEDRILVADKRVHETYQGIDGTYKVETGWWSSKKLTFKKGILVAIDGSTQDETTEDISPTTTLGSSTQPIYLSNGEFKAGEAYYKKSEVYTQTQVDNLLYNHTQQAMQAFALVGHTHSNYSLVGHTHNYATFSQIETLSNRISALEERVSNIKSCTCTPTTTN